MIAVSSGSYSGFSRSRQLQSRVHLKKCLQFTAPIRRHLHIHLAMMKVYSAASDDQFDSSINCGHIYATAVTKQLLHLAPPLTFSSCVQDFLCSLCSSSPLRPLDSLFPFSPPSLLCPLIHTGCKCLHRLQVVTRINVR